MSGRLATQRDGRFGWLTIDNPARRNAVSLDMWEAMPDALHALASDRDVRVILVRGAGGKAFASGADISEFRTRRSSGEDRRLYAAASGRAVKAIAECAKPTVAAIDGFCIGGGFALALACDLRVATDVSQFAIPAGRLGVAYSPDSVRLLIDAVGPAAAREVLLTARRYDAAEASRLGMVHRVFGKQDFDAEVAAYAGAIAENAPLTMAASKRTVTELRKGEGAGDMAMVERMVEQCFESRDYREGRDAFMGKRRPGFIGS